MQMFYAKSANIAEIYVIARDQQDAVDIYVSFQKLLATSQDICEIKRVDDGPGWKPNRAVRRILKAGTRGVGMPFPKANEWLTEASEWIIWYAPPNL
jgi:hypothetical protein